MKCLVSFILLAALLATPVFGLAAEQQVVGNPNSEAVSHPGAEKHHIMKDLEHYLAKVKPLLDRYGYAAVFVAVMIEGCGIPAPGQTLLMAGSLAAASKQMNMGLLLTVAVAAAILGNTLGYFLGRWGGRAILNKFRVNEQRMERVEKLFSRYGGGVILFARFLDGLRQLNGIVAGILEMPWWHFTFFNVLGAFLWTFFWGLGLFYLDENIYLFHLALQHLGILVPALAVISFILLIIYLLRRRDANHET